MIDKEKILDFLKKKHENFSKQYEETKDYILDSLALEYSLLWSIISMGKLYIEQTKETCKWTLRRYFLRRDLLLEKRKDNHVKSRLKNADI